MDGERALARPVSPYDTGESDRAHRRREAHRPVVNWARCSRRERERRWYLEYPYDPELALLIAHTRLRAEQPIRPDGETRRGPGAAEEMRSQRSPGGHQEPGSNLAVRSVYKTGYSTWQR